MRWKNNIIDKKKKFIQTIEQYWTEKYFWFLVSEYNIINCFLKDSKGF